MIIHTLPRGRIHVGDWLQADLAPGYDLAIVDGPYAMGIAAWDKMKLDDLAEWYTPHIARLTSLMAPSASVYLWNTAAGWARLDPVMRAAGWELRSVLHWDKGATPAQIGFAAATGWLESTETCGFYVRGEPAFVCKPDDLTVWRTPTGYSSERLRSGDERIRKRGCPPERVPLHPCQKPLAFAERMIRASTRPGGRVLAPFGGTCREAVVCEWLARVEPDEAREYDVCELNADGRDYIGPVLAQIRGEDTRATARGQVRLFGGGAA